MFKSVNKFLGKASEVIDQASESLEQKVDSMSKQRKIKKDKALQKYKEERAQMIIDGNYDSEEAMDKDLAEIEAQVLGKK
ncbi:hypothetical protein [Psychrobacter sanguinis]|uniref:Uncharacterized protein n=1 Tax=Psychrobacter sanguinis TaxID=861445 RepID=A0A844M2T5_9GAMM|nr:hypothetical protein [Psychrobacter sanguinis]MUG33272.1 hypothetical protein [Psychrobacter sanguinis]